MTQKNYQALCIFEISLVAEVYLNCIVVFRFEDTICALLFVSLARVLHTPNIWIGEASCCWDRYKI